jgi:hypothetical protein
LSSVYENLFSLKHAWMLNLEKFSFTNPNLSQFPHFKLGYSKITINPKRNFGKEGGFSLPWRMNMASAVSG